MSAARYIVVKQSRLDALPDAGIDTSLFIRPFADYSEAVAKARSLFRQSGGEAYRVIDLRAGFCDMAETAT